ncbi:MAG: hypothetical protein IT458_15200 [Planctomycetes bacterium]|nr:hypothetical protein [Planctomycetota bacterium]
MRLRESRRLHGPSLLLPESGVELDVDAERGPALQLAEAWRDLVENLLARLGWSRERIVERAQTHGVRLALAAPVDALATAQEAGEWAFGAAQAQLAGGAAADVAVAAERLRALAAREARPALQALRQAASARKVAFYCDATSVTVGQGTGARSFSLEGLPDPDALDWQGIHDIPVALVAGSRLRAATVATLARILAASGRVFGVGGHERMVVAGTPLRVGGEGPHGAAVLRDPRVELAVLEAEPMHVARLGTGLRHVHAAVVTDADLDPGGTFGMDEVRERVEIVFTVQRALAEPGRLVLNAEDELVLEHGRHLPKPLLWFGADPQNPQVLRHGRAGGDVATVARDMLVVVRRRHAYGVVPLPDIVTLADGTPLAAVLGAAGAAAAMDLPMQAIAAGLST